jgi:hypothetical protein
MLERFESDQPDKDKLLAAMESDKVAAARAVGQNQLLKQQLEELQEGFVKMVSLKLCYWSIRKELIAEIWTGLSSK